jgi:Flp pilus assembly protein TadG
MTRRFNTNQRGAALLEVAITIPLILAICVGIFEFGRAFQTWQVLTNAAREGARVAVITGRTDADVTKVVKDYVTAGALGGPATVTIARNEALVGTNTASRVTVAYPYKFMVLNPVMKLLHSGSTTGAPLTMTVNAVMRNEI